MPFGRVFARWSSQRRSPRSQRAGQIADEPKEGRSRARQRAREVPRGPPCRGWSLGQRRSRQKENPTRFSSADEPILLNYRSVTRGVAFDFFLPLFRAAAARCPGEVSSKEPPCIMGATFGHPPAEGPETYARERDPGRGSATGSRKVVPPAGPSHLTPSSPGEAKSRSREPPRCPHQF